MSLIMNLYSYIVRYDSGFSPNPFYGYCTLAACKQTIRKGANIGDWIVGCGSADKNIQQGGRLVYAMQIAEVCFFNEYFKDDRFQNKKPNLNGSRKQARGDNIYYKLNNSWKQSDSYHSKIDGSPNLNHIRRDTSIDRVLISHRYVYFGANGPAIPICLTSNGKPLCHKGRGHSRFSTTTDKVMIKFFEKWLYSLKKDGFVGNPFDWGE